MDNQTTAPEVQSEQTEAVVQNNTEATAEVKETNFRDLIPENFREERAAAEQMQMEMQQQMAESQVAKNAAPLAKVIQDGSQ